MSRVFAVGKIRADPEYLGDKGPFDRWLYEGVEAAYERWGQDWERALRKGPWYSFLWEDYCGVLAPSRDSVGRDYPLAIVSEVPRSNDCARFAACAGFFALARLVIEEVRGGSIGKCELSRRLTALRSPGAEDVAHAQAAYEEWSARTTVPDAWHPILQEEKSMTVGLTSSGGVMRLPLGEMGLRGVTLWLDVLARLFGQPRSVFWSSERRHVAVCRGIPAALVGSLWPVRALDWTDVTLGAVSASGRMAAFLDSLRPF